MRKPCETLETPSGPGSETHGTFGTPGELGRDTRRGALRTLSKNFGTFLTTLGPAIL